MHGEGTRRTSYVYSLQIPGRKGWNPKAGQSHVAIPRGGKALSCWLLHSMDVLTITAPLDATRMSDHIAFCCLCIGCHGPDY